MAVDPVKACQHKHQYPSARAAQVAKRERQQLAHKPMWVYWCVHCGHYHLTHREMDWGGA